MLSSLNVGNFTQGRFDGWGASNANFSSGRYVAAPQDRSTDLQPLWLDHVAGASRAGQARLRQAHLRMRPLPTDTRTRGGDRAARTFVRQLAGLVQRDL